MPRHLNRPLFTCCDGETDLVEHISYYIPMMSLYYQNDALMCKVFPSSLGPTTMRWFNGLRKRSIHNYGKLIHAFWARLSPAIKSFNRSRHCYPKRWEMGRLFSRTRIGTGSCTTKQQEEMSRRQQVLLGSGSLKSRIEGFSDHASP